MCNEEDTANVIPAPATPHSQSSAARRLQEVEKHIGSVVDLVVQYSQHPGRLASSQSISMKLIYSLQQQPVIHLNEDRHECCDPLLVRHGLLCPYYPPTSL
jgi:hypothetical protein